MAIRLEILVDNKGNAILKQFQGELDKTGKGASDAALKIKSSWSQVESTFDKLHGKIRSFATSIPAMLGYAGLTASAYKLIKAGMDEEAMYKRLETSVKAVGVAYKTADPAIKDFISTMTRTTQFGDDETVPLLQEITQLTGSLQKGFIGTKLAADIAASGLMGMDQAGRLIGMALTGNVEMLGRYIPALRASSGIITENMTASERAATAVNLLTKMFGGQAQENLNTFSAKISQIKNYFGDMVEAIGQVVIDRLSPTIDRWRKKIIEFVESGKFAEWLDMARIKMEAFFKKAEDVFNYLVQHKDTILNAFKAAAIIAIVVEIVHLGLEIKRAIGFISMLGKAFTTLTTISVTQLGLIGAATFTIIKLYELNKAMKEADSSTAKLKETTELFLNTQARAGEFVKEHAEQLKKLGIEFKVGPGGSFIINQDSIKSEFKKAGKSAWENFSDGLNEAAKSDSKFLAGILYKELAIPTVSKLTPNYLGLRGGPESWGKTESPFVEELKEPKTPIMDLEKAGKPYKIWADAFSNAFRAAAEVVQSELSLMWDKAFGKANSVFQKMSRAFLNAFIGAIMEVAAKMAALWFLKLLFPTYGATGGFEKLLGITAHQGMYIPRMHGGSLRNDEMYAIYQRGEYVMPRQAVTPRTLPVLNQIKQTGSASQNFSVNIAGDEVSVSGILDTRTLSDLKNLLSNRKQDLAEEVEYLLKSRRLAVA